MSLTLAEALRYFLSGVVVLVYWWAFDWAFDRTTVGAILLVRKPAVVASVALAGGAIAHIVYRVIFYETLIVGLQDWFRWQTDNYRTFLRNTSSRPVPRSWAICTSATCPGFLRFHLP